MNVINYSTMDKLIITSIILGLDTNDDDSIILHMYMNGKIVDDQYTVHVHAAFCIYNVALVSRPNFLTS